MERRRATRITSKLALAWAQRPETTDPNHLAGRLRAIRSFARYRIVADPRTEIPPTDLLPRQRSSFRPHIFSQEEIARLLAASLQRRRGAKPISRWSRYALFGLLSVTGMRVGEALNLDLEDVDLDHGVLTIRNAKFGKSRLVPGARDDLHRPDTVSGAARCVPGGPRRHAVLHIAAGPQDHPFHPEPVVPPAVPETGIAR